MVYPTKPHSVKEQLSLNLPEDVFIFIVDRSGSMKGKKMEMTIEALKLFISSLPPRSKFEIISFGSTYSTNCMKENTDKEVKSIKDKINQMNANMGGTNIYDPLRFAIKENLNKDKKQSKKSVQYNRKIFLLTDGAVKEPEKVIELARENNKTCQIHTFGVGNGCSKYLVKSVAKAGRGSYSFVEEDDNLKAKVIRALKKAIEPSLQGC